MRIALIFNRFRSDGGTERIALNSFQALAADDFEPVVIARKWGGPAQSNVRFVQCRPVSVGRSWRLLAFTRAVRRLLRRLDVDLVQSQVHVPDCDVYRADGGAHAEWLRQRRRVGGRLTRLWRAVEPYHRLKLRMERKMYASPRLRAVICNSEMVRGDIRRHYPDCRADLRVIDYGIDLERFRRTPDRLESGRKARSSLGIDQDSPVFAYVGSGFERKGLDVAIRALAMASGDARLLAVGRDNRMARYRRLAKRLGVHDRVHFMGAQSDVRPFLWAADALVHPALYEPFGLVALEAMAAGLPVIASDRTGASLALVETGRTGWILDALDARGFAETMTTVVKSRTDVRDGMRRACEQAAAQYTLARMRTNLLDFYTSLLRQQLPGS